MPNTRSVALFCARGRHSSPMARRLLRGRKSRGRRRTLAKVKCGIRGGRNTFARWSTDLVAGAALAQGQAIDREMGRQIGRWIDR